jgi:hypothetical protein
MKIALRKLQESSNAAFDNFNQANRFATAAYWKGDWLAVSKFNRSADLHAKCVAYFERLIHEELTSQQ